MVKLCEHKYTIDMYMYLHVYEEDIIRQKEIYHSILPVIKSCMAAIKGSPFLGVIMFDLDWKQRSRHFTE